MAIAPFENPALASGGTGDVLAGHDRVAAGPEADAVRGRPARGLPPRPRRRRDPGAVRRLRAARLGPAGGDRDRPEAAGGDRRAQGDGRQARLRVARRRGGGRRLAGLGSAARRRHPATPRPETGRSPALSEAVGRPTAGTTGRPRPGPIEDRLAAAGLPPLPRTAWIEIDLEALAGNLAVARAAGRARGPRRARRQGRRLRPRDDPGRPGAGRGGRRRALRRDPRRGAGAAGRRRRWPADPVLYPVPPALAGRAAERRVAVAAGDPALLRALARRRAAGDAPAGRRSTSSSRSRAGWGAAASRSRGRSRPPRRSRRPAARAWPASGRTSRRPRTPPGPPPRSSGSRPRSQALAAAGVEVPRRHVAASGGLLDAARARLRRRPAGADRRTASCPTSSIPRRSPRPSPTSGR